ncbi:uncharacterized protein LOC113762585 [Coffea eugenioides]|uniref:uncharacterized protein LOC113762543 n=1 Tax=Coffea eugenioides TaxID=49369 RepID=UPI000F60AF9B|nr:uncharacterized protein LOC113762543 [Coffea eugenioides]XP_027161837.1 uncharacterized protein LOC113762543 [Coffea eugenioides]XP_027161897.1 uncharacterized protein LOC113762585 [Coffea eugenioides]XP_027161898.1 uncharacterized protein LOC113762585 [Coffea eugenioides]
MLSKQGEEGGAGGRFYWVKGEQESGCVKKSRGIVVVFAWWGSIQETQLKDFTDLYSSLGWNSLVCLAHFLNPFTPERATSLAFCIVSQLVEELRSKPCPIVLASLSGGSQACLYKVFQIIDGGCEVQLNLNDSRLVRSCISGQIYDSGPVDVTSDLGARFSVHPTVLKMPGSAKLVSLVAKGVTSGLDALFITKFGSQQTDYWQSLYSSVSLGAPFLVLCSDCDDLAPYPIICNFSQRLRDAGGAVEIVKWKNSPHVGHYSSYPIQYRAAVAELLERSNSIFFHKIQRLGEQIGTDLGGMPGEISDLICDLQNAAVNSNQSLRRVAVGPEDHFFLPSSMEHDNFRDSRSSQEDRKEKLPSDTNPRMDAHGVLGQILFDACVPKNIEGWDIKFSGSLNGQPFASASRRSPLKAIKFIGRSRL